MSNTSKHKRRVLTAREKLMRKRYTRLVHWPFSKSYTVFLQVDVQGFRVNGDFDTKLESEWMRDMVAIALARIEP